MKNSLRSVRSADPQFGHGHHGRQHGNWYILSTFFFSREINETLIDLKKFLYVGHHHGRPGYPGEYPGQGYPGQGYQGQGFPGQGYQQGGPFYPSQNIGGSSSNANAQSQNFQQGGLGGIGGGASAANANAQSQNFQQGGLGGLGGGASAANANAQSQNFNQGGLGGAGGSGIVHISKLFSFYSSITHITSILFSFISLIGQCWYTIVRFRWTQWQFIEC